MIDEYLRQMLVTDYKDPTYTITISSLDVGEECDHETITIGLKQYNPCIYDLFKDFYIKIMGLDLTEKTLSEINELATCVVEDYLDENGDYITVNDRKLVLRSGLEYDNNQKMYRSVLNANIVDGLPTSTSKEKTVIVSDDSDIFIFTPHEDVCIPLYLKIVDTNAELKGQILMITLMDHQKNNIFDNKTILITDKNGHVLYYPTALPTEADQNDYDSGTGFYGSNSYFDINGVSKYKYYIKVDYPGNEQYKSFSKEFTVFIAQGVKSKADSNSGGS